MPPKVLCLCTKCAKLTVLENGKTLPGQRISTSSRTAHERADHLAKLKDEAGIQPPPVATASKPEIGGGSSSSSIPTSDVFQRGMHINYRCVGH